MSYPTQCPRTYSNPGGNLAASGYYRSSMTQEVANMMPPWMHMRENNRSIGQQFISPAALHLKRLENSLNESIKSKFLTTASLDEIDVLYRVKVPSNVDLTDVSASGVRCVAAPSGCSPSGVSQIWVSEIDNLEEFYYNVLPTRIEVTSSGSYTSTVDGVGWHVKPSGILDTEEKQIDYWNDHHEITWCYTDDSPVGHLRKQDRDSMEDYEIYERPGTGSITDMDFYRGTLWSINKHVGSYYLTVASAKTQMPNSQSLDTLAIFNITDAFSLEPSGILAADDGKFWICDTNKTRIFEINPRYDYFILDKDNRYIYFREDYRDSGVFVSNT